MPNFTAKEYMVLLIVFTVCVLALLAGLVIVLSKLRIKSARLSKKDGLSVSVGDSPEDASGSNTSPHKLCGNGKDIVILLTEHEDMLYEVYRKEFRILDKQIAIADAAVSRMRGKAQGIFLKLLKKKLEIPLREGLIEHIDYERYSNVLRDVKDVMFPLVKSDFELDEMELMSEGEFKTYAESKSNKIVQEITDFLNSRYFGVTVKREDLYDENRASIQSELRQTIEDVYWAARKVAIDTLQETKQMRKAFRDRLREMV